MKDRARLATQAMSLPETDITSTVELPPPVKISSGPANSIAAMMSDKRILDENLQLKEDLKVWEGAYPARHTDPLLVIPSKWANRHSDSFSGPEYQALKDDIESAGGNVQAIKVRPVPDSIPQTYEIVFGHRRHRACCELGLPVLAVIESISDQALFAEMDRENRQRADLRPYEQGLMYARALDDGLYSSMRKMADALGTDQSNISKYVALARLPVEVLSAFNTPLDLQQRWGLKLAQAIEKNQSKVISLAQQFAELKPRLNASKVFKSLVQEDFDFSDVQNITKRAPHAVTTVVGIAEQKGSIKFDSQKKIFAINLEGISESRLDEIRVAVEKIVNA